MPKDHGDPIRSACRALLQTPGVASVSYGLATEDGVLTDTPILRVYLERRAWARGRQRAFPAKLHGIRVRVGPALDVRPFCICPYRPGDKISRHTPAGTGASGTLACFLQRNGKKYLLTNHHVLLRSAGLYNSSNRNDIVNSSSSSSAFDDEATLVSDDPNQKDLRLENADQVFQPKRSDCLGFECNNPLGIIKALDDQNVGLKTVDVGTRKYWVDAAVAEIESGRTISNEIPDLGMIKQTIRDVGAELIDGTPLPQVTVYKSGFVTGTTQGKIRDFFQAVSVGGTPTSFYEFTVRAEGDKKYEHEYDEKEFELDDAEPRNGAQIKTTLEDGTVTVEVVNPRKIRVKGKLFSYPGDSGSLVVDDQRRPVGLLWGGNGLDLKVKGESAPVFVPSGISIACYIKPVLDTLNFKNADAIVLGTIKARGPDMPPPEPDLSDTFADAERRLRASDRGRELMAAITAHAEEVRALVLRGGRVSAIWRRYHGPGFVAAALAAARDPARALISEIEGISAETFVSRMHRAILSEASEGLCAALARHIGLIIMLVRQARTFDDVVRLVEEPVPLAAE